MIIALTGAFGSLGKELTPYFEELGHTVLQISSSRVSNNKNIFSFHDLQNRSIKKSVDLLIHLASHNSNMSEDQIPEEVKLLEDVLFSMSSLNCNKLIFLSSAKVYGDNSLDYKIFNESSSLEPVCSYGKAKKQCEYTIINSSTKLNMHALILRLPPILNWASGSSIINLINFANSSYFMPTFKIGNENHRSFLSIDNLKKAMTFLTSNQDFFSGVKIYNLSDEGVVSINDVLSFRRKNHLIHFPNIIFSIFIRLPILKSFLLRLYGNFVVDNSKLKSDMNVTLISTKDSISIIQE